MKPYREAQRARRLIENGDAIGADWDGGYVLWEQPWPERRYIRPQFYSQVTLNQEWLAQERNGADKMNPYTRRARKLRHAKREARRARAIIEQGVEQPGQDRTFTSAEQLGKQAGLTREQLAYAILKNGR